MHYVIQEFGRRVEVQFSVDINIPVSENHG